MPHHGGLKRGCATPDDLAAAGTAHHGWWALGAFEDGWHERLEGCDIYAVAGSGTIAFPSAGADLESAIRLCRERGLREVGCWSLAGDDSLGHRLTRLGFQDGWQPHWMAADPSPADGLGDVARLDGGDRPSIGLPYWSGNIHPARPGAPCAAVHLGVRSDGGAAGHVAVLLAGRVAGIFDMGVSPAWRRRGIGLRLTRAALALACEEGCDVAVLNATGEGEPVYRRAGFRSVGMGATWWWFR